MPVTHGADVIGLVDLLVTRTTPVAEDGAVELPLDGYGYRWLRVVGPDSRRLV